MKCLIASLCVMALAALPTGASANTGSEAASAKPIVIAYIPEHLQLRVPWQTDEHRTSPTLPQGDRVQPVADASGGLQWDMWEPTPTQQPKFEVEYVPPTPERTEQQRRRARLLGIGLGLGIPLVMGAAIGTAMALQSIDQLSE